AAATLDLTARKGRPLRLAACALAAVAALALGGAMLFQQAFLTGLPTAPDRTGLWGAGRPPGGTFLDKDGQGIAHRGPRHGAPHASTWRPAAPFRAARPSPSSSLARCSWAPTRPCAARFRRRPWR